MKEYIDKCINTCVRTHTHTHVQTCMHTHRRGRTDTHRHRHRHTGTRARAHTHTHAHTHTRRRSGIHTHCTSTFCTRTHIQAQTSYMQSHARICKHASKENLPPVTLISHICLHSSPLAIIWTHFAPTTYSIRLACRSLPLCLCGHPPALSRAAEH